MVRAKSATVSRTPSPTSLPAWNRLDPPSWATPASKLTRVRSDGFSNTRPTTLCRRVSANWPRGDLGLQPGGLGEEVPQGVGVVVEDRQEVAHGQWSVVSSQWSAGQSRVSGLADR